MKQTEAKLSGVRAAFIIDLVIGAKAGLLVVEPADDGCLQFHIIGEALAVFEEELTPEARQVLQVTLERAADELIKRWLR